MPTAGSKDCSNKAPVRSIKSSPAYLYQVRGDTGEGTGNDGTGKKGWRVPGTAPQFSVISNSEGLAHRPSEWDRLHERVNIGTLL